MTDPTYAAMAGAVLIAMSVFVAKVWLAWSWRRDVARWRCSRHHDYQYVGYGGAGWHLIKCRKCGYKEIT